MDLNISNNKETSQFEVNVEGHTALVAYTSSPGKITFTHTEVPQALEGRGIASALAKHVLQFARDNQLKVVPLCPFISGYIRKHPEAYRDLLAPGYEYIK